jgi:hypothetical protein
VKSGTLRGSIAVDLAESEKRTVEIALAPESAALPTPPQPPAVLPPTAPSPQVSLPAVVAAPVAPPLAPDAASPGMGGQRIAGIALIGVGAGALVAGAALGGVALSKKSASNEGPCQDNKCDEAGLALRADAIRMANASTGLFVAGALLAGGGLAVFFTAPKTARTTTARLGLTMGGVEVNGAW